MHTQRCPHTSYNDYKIVAANLFDGEDRRVSDRITASALYGDHAGHAYPPDRGGIHADAARQPRAAEVALAERSNADGHDRSVMREI
jgi:hypothetical protein